jgi:chromosome segregation ATPase
MEVKSVYMDLVEGKRKGNVWKLESEAFKKPIEIKICYDNQELAQFNSRFSDLESLAELNKQKFMQLQKEDLNQDEEIDELRREIEGQKDTNIFLGEEIQKNKSELKELYKAIADAKTTIETLS